ncbi:hypothetical protein AVEN_80514-1 [Araneus ventricosus]|uniref:Uncharacterized protein n=1 Tax=Araneus ventricosus TaxID=182803 RepID=A0A4Y2VG40_ARAVE|nr:hypothetical protein AVEN_80514-1 [Araneus ventricosus]
MTERFYNRQNTSLPQFSNLFSSFSFAVTSGFIVSSTTIRNECLCLMSHDGLQGKDATVITDDQENAALKVIDARSGIMLFKGAWTSMSVVASGNIVHIGFPDGSDVNYIQPKDSIGRSTHLEWNKDQGPIYLSGHPKGDCI